MLGVANLPCCGPSQPSVMSTLGLEVSRQRSAELGSCCLYSEEVAQIIATILEILDFIRFITIRETCHEN